MSTDFVPEGFTPPDGLIADTFVLEPLGPEHNLGASTTLARIKASRRL
jgi:hypothetical protein